MGILNPGREVPDVEKIFHDEESVRRLIGRLGEPRLLRTCYEAGPTGYDLARLLASMSARVRHKSRTASSLGVGIRTATSSPARCRRARRRQSRVSVLTLSPGALGIIDGAITSHATPIGPDPGPLTRTERGLAVFGLAGLLFTVVALATAWTFWGPIARRLVTALSNAGAGGRIVLVLLLVLIVGPLAHAVIRLIMGLGRRARSMLGDVRFWLQTSWRSEAAHAIADLPVMAALGDAELADLAGRVARRRVTAGQGVVKEHSAPDSFFLVRSGRFAVTEQTADGGERLLRHLGAGDAFGELALLERRPRTATVRAEMSGQLFVVDAGTFGRLLAPAMPTSGLMATYQRSLLEVWALPPFRHLDQAAAATLSGRGEWVSRGPNEAVVTQGEMGDRFYVLAAGQAEVVRDGQQIAILHAGDHFGELALLHQIPRTATVRTMTPARLFSLDADTFTALVGSAFTHSRLGAGTHEHDTTAAH